MLQGDLPVRNKEINNRAVLRCATREMHDRAEQFWSGADIARFPIRRFLHAMYQLHSGFGLWAAQQSGFDIAVRQEEARLDNLVSDLGCEPERIWRQAGLSGRDSAWGVLYALNGSALGASVLLREGGHRSAYLSLMQDYAKSGQLGAFIRALNDRVLDRDAAVMGAEAVFYAMARDDFSGEMVNVD